MVVFLTLLDAPGLVDLLEDGVDLARGLVEVAENLADVLKKDTNRDKLINGTIFPTLLEDVMAYYTVY